jgi:hypothetical protein
MAPAKVEARPKAVLPSFFARVYQGLKFVEARRFCHFSV